MDSPKFNCGCETGKSCFQSYDLARAAIRRFRRKRSAIKRDGSYLAVYRCKFCSDWHIGNTEKRADKRCEPIKKHRDWPVAFVEAAKRRWKANLAEITRRLSEQK